MTDHPSPFVFLPGSGGGTTDLSALTANNASLLIKSITQVGSAT